MDINDKWTMDIKEKKNTEAGFYKCNKYIWFYTYIIFNSDTKYIYFKT